jgi:dienelactone hydrolase
MNDRISIEGRDSAFGTPISQPKTLPAPAVVVLHEVFGVNHNAAAAALANGRTSEFLHQQRR